MIEVAVESMFPFVALYGAVLVSGTVLSGVVTHACLRGLYSPSVSQACARQLERVWEYNAALPSGLLNFFAGAGLAVGAMKAREGAAPVTRDEQG